MKRILFIGIEPAAVDFADPDLPPGLTSEKVAAGIETAMADMRARDWAPVFCAILTDDSVEATIAACLADSFDCVVIGAGIRLPARGLALFERVVNAVVQGAPGTRIAFSTSPPDTADAAARWLAD